jgi:hypothetical protein
MCCHECQEWSFREGERLVGYLDGKEYLEHGIPWVISAEEAERRGYTPKRPKQYRAPYSGKESSPEEIAAWNRENTMRHSNWFALKKRREEEGLQPLDPVEWIKMWNGETA